MNLHSFTAIYSFTKGPFKNYEGKEKGETSFFSFLTQTDSPETHFHSLLDILVYQWCLNQILYRDY